MTVVLQESAEAGMQEAAAQIQEAAAAKKCWSCGCLHISLLAIERALPQSERSAELDTAIRAAKSKLLEIRYDCLGCKGCYPAVALNVLSQSVTGQPLEVPDCPGERVEERPGWPPFSGAYQVLRYTAPVAVCTLTDEGLAGEIAKQAGTEVAIVGTLQTENLGIERLALNVLGNPNIRFVLLCGPDSRQPIGHLPGQSLVALSRSGVDERQRIVGAEGRRPVLKNIGVDAIEHFRRTVEIVDLIGNGDVPAILDVAKACTARWAGPAEPFAPERLVTPLPGYLPEHLIPDPAGYFVVYVDRRRQLLSLEHYRNDGALDTVIEGGCAAEIYVPAIEKGLVSRLDHAAYLGRELARAERALSSGESYVQDAAPERQPVTSGCGCGSACEGGR